MPEKVGKEKIVREKGFLYYLKDGFVWASPMKTNKDPKAKPHKVGTEKITSEKGFVYYLGSDGFVERAPRKAKGSGPKKEKKAKAKKAAAPKKAAAKKPAAKPVAKK
jgi:hypothetical protein